ncbi:MAG: Fur family transcriptional regulator [Desulfitobacteriaceae bacterium]
MNYEEITKFLRQHGYRLTEARKHVIDVLCQHHKYLGAYDIHHILEETGIHTGIASIYRVLDMLDSLEILQREEFGQGGIRYRLLKPAQHHSHQLICSKCGQTQEVKNCPLANWAKNLESESGYQILEHWLRLFGLCPNCREPSANFQPPLDPDTYVY